MKSRFFSGAVAAKAAVAVLSVLAVGQASAAYRATSWGALSLNYYALNNAPYPMSGSTQDRSVDGYCVYMAARQYGWTNYPLSFHGYTRTCTGQVHNWSFDTLYPMDIVELWTENPWQSNVRVWQR